MSSQGLALLKSERGTALALALFALVVGGALVAGSFYLAQLEQRGGENERSAHISLGSAEGGALEVLRAWNSAAYNARGIYPTDSLVLASTSSPNSTGAYAGNVYRLTNTLFMIDVTGRDSASANNHVRDIGGARQRLGMIVRTIPLQLPGAAAALTVGGPIRFGGGNVFVYGQDVNPPGVTGCATPGPDAIGVRARNGGDVNNSNGQVHGNPAVQVDATIDSTSFMNFGTQNYNSLAALATIVNPGVTAPVPVTSGATCVVTPPSTYGISNWGEPNNSNTPCSSRFPIIHYTGNATLGGANARGQGILLVDGDLTFNGAFKFNGLVIVKGQMVSAPGGSPTIYGAIMVRNMNLGTTSWSGNANFRYSTCALSAARNLVTETAMLRSRGWAQLY